MKRFRKFALALEPLEWPNNLRYQFYLRSRPLCNFIERELAREPMNIMASSKLVLVGTQGTNKNFFINSSGVASVSVPIDVTAYKQMESEEDIYSFMADFSQQGVLSCPNLSPEARNHLVGLIEKFRSIGFVNAWVFKKKTFRARKLVAELRCKITQTDFLLTLEVTKSGAVVFSQVILRTDPDELAFHCEFKDIVFQEHCLTVSKRVGSTPLIEIPYADLS